VRFENAAGRADLYRLGTAVATPCCLYHRERLGDRVPLITIDLDATDDPTHGSKEGTGSLQRHYDTWVLSAAGRHRDVQHRADAACVAAVLRRPRAADPRRCAGAAPAVQQTAHAVSERAAARAGRRRVSPRASSWRFSTRRRGVCAGLAGNRRLDNAVRRLLGGPGWQARTTGDTATLYGETRYAARRWAHKRRIIMKAEVLCYPGRSPKDNPRFLVTNLPHRPATVYTRLNLPAWRHGEPAQGTAEAGMDRTPSCSACRNQLRLLFSLAPTSCQVLQGFAAARPVGPARLDAARALAERSP